MPYREDVLTVEDWEEDDVGAFRKEARDPYEYHQAARSIEPPLYLIYEAKGYVSGRPSPDLADVVVVKPYWAIACLVAASSAITILVTLVATIGVEPLAAAFLGLFGAGLGTSALGLLITSPSTHSATGR